MSKSKIILRRDNLLYAMSRTILFTKEKPVLPVEALFKFEPLVESVRLCSFDGETYAECNVIAEIKGAEAIEPFLVEAKKLYSIINSQQDEDLEISFRKKGQVNIAVFKTARSKHEFPWEADAMPIHTAMPKLFSFSLPGSDLKTISGTVVNLLDKKDETTMGQGVGFQYVAEAKALYVWGGMLARAGGYKIPMATEPVGFTPFIMPAKVMRNMDDLVSGNESVDISFDGHLCEITGQNIYLRTTVSNGKYPDLYKYLATLTNQGTVVSLSVGEVRLCVDRLIVHCDELMTTGALSFGDKQLNMTIDNTAFATMGDETAPYLSAEKNQPIVVGVNLKHMQMVLKQTIADRADFAVQSHKSGILITSSKENRTIIFILMPCMLETL